MRWGALAACLLVGSLLLAGCGGAPARTAEPPAALTIGGRPVVDAQGLQMQAEAELSYTIGFGYVARAGDAVNCWFARTGAQAEVDRRLWCGPVQVPGTAAATDWVPVPLKEVDTSDGGVRLQVEPPQVPDPGSRSTPLGKLVRTDGREADADGGAVLAGPDFLAVQPDDGRPLDAASGLVRDDQLALAVTGYGSPESWGTEQGELRAEHGVRLRVLRLTVERLRETDSAFQQVPWSGWLPQPPEAALQVPGKRHPLPTDRFPESGSVFVVYTVPDAGGQEALVLDTVGARSLEQRVEVPSGNPLGEAFAALRRLPGPAEPTPVTHRLKVSGGEGVREGSLEGSLEVERVRLGRQRPVNVDGQRYGLVTASAPDKALLELRLKGKDLPRTTGAALTGDLVAVTLPDGSRAPVVGARYGGDTFPVAVVVEVPADVRSVSVAVTAGTVALPILGDVTFEPGEPAVVPLDF